MSVRPHFDLVVDRPIAEVMQTLSSRFAEERQHWAGHVTGTHAQLVVRRSQRRIWSPWLSFEVKDKGESSLLTGRFAPHPSFWTMYMAAYGIVGFLLLGLGFFGLSQWLAGEPPTMLWSVPICTALLLGLYVSAYVGQGLGAEQMHDMRMFLGSMFPHESSSWVEPVAPVEIVVEQAERA